MRFANPGIRIEILTPDFRGKGRMERALEALAGNPPDVFNHNLETVRALYREVRPGADYDWSLDLLKRFKAQHPDVPTKSGIMLGLGETWEQIEETLNDLRAHDVDMVTIGQYLQPTRAPSSGAALLDAGRVQGDRAARLPHRLRARRLGSDGALLVPRGRDGARRGVRSGRMSDGLGAPASQGAPRADENSSPVAQS